MVWFGNRVLDTANWIDDFEDTDFSEWNGDTGVLSQSTSVVQQGSGSANLSSDGSAVKIYSTSGNGLDNYFPIGNEMEVLVHSDYAGENRINYGWADNSNYFRIELLYGDNKLRIVRNDSANGVDVPAGTTNGGGGLSTNTWQKLYVKWDDGSLGGSNGDHTVELRALDDSAASNEYPLTFNDTNHSSNDGVMMGTFLPSGNNFYVDGWELL